MEMFSRAYNNAKPKFNEEQAQRDQRIAKFHAYNNVLKSVVDAVGGSFGGTIQKNENSPLPYLNHYDEMVNKYNTDVSNHQMAYAKDMLNAELASDRNDLMFQQFNYQKHQGAADNSWRKRQMDIMQQNADTSKIVAEKNIQLSKDKLAEDIAARKSTDGYRNRSLAESQYQFNERQAQEWDMAQEQLQFQREQLKNMRGKEAAFAMSKHKILLGEDGSKMIELSGNMVNALAGVAVMDANFMRQFGDMGGWTQPQQTAAMNENEHLKKAVVSRWLARQDDEGNYATSLQSLIDLDKDRNADIMSITTEKKERTPSARTGIVTTRAEQRGYNPESHSLIDDLK